jgi:hypothetical protein
MKNLAQASVILVALLGASGALAVAAAGCGGDDTSVGGGDAQSDVTVDQTSSDAKPDHATEKDATKDKDAKDKDVEDEGEASIGDDASDADASPVTPALLAFPNKVNTAYCERIAQCCGFDGGAGFNITQCVADITESNGIANVSAAQVDGGHIALDETASNTCLANMAVLNCATVQDPQYASTLIACSTAMQGLVGANAGKCTSYWDCTAGNYCLVEDGGASHCVPLGSAEGGPCVDTTFSTDCSYRGDGNPPRFCSPIGDGSTGVCQPDFALSEGCDANATCLTQICDPATAAPTTLGSCQNSSSFIVPGPDGICGAYILDGGTD